MAKFKVGDKVNHTQQETVGIVVEVKALVNGVQGYKVYWIAYKKAMNYKEKFLSHVKPCEPVIPEWVRVTDPRLKGLWYRDRVGDKFRVSSDCGGEVYGVFGNNKTQGFIATIRKEDCEPCLPPEENIEHPAKDCPEAIGVNGCKLMHLHDACTPDSDSCPLKKCSRCKYDFEPKYPVNITLTISSLEEANTLGLDLSCTPSLKKIHWQFKSQLEAHGIIKPD